MSLETTVRKATILFSKPDFTLSLSLSLSLCFTGVTRGQTAQPGSLTLSRWAGWSAGQVGRHVQC